MKNFAKIALALGGISAVCAGFAIGTMTSTNKVAETVKAAMTTSDAIYFDKNAYASDSTWVNETVYFRYYTGSADGYLECTKIANNDRYWYVKPSSLTFAAGGGFCFRAANSGSNDFRETKWISWSTWSSGTFNVVKLSGSNDSGDNYRANYATDALLETSSAQGGSVVYNNVNSSADTERIWVRSSIDWWYNDSARTAVKVWTTVSGITTVNIYKTTAIQNTDDNLYYWYADVPTSITGLQFVRLHSVIDGVFNYSEDANKANTAGVNYLSTGSGSNLAVSFGSPNNPNPVLCKTVLEGFTTCSSSAVNGYGAVSSLNTNFISKLTSDELTTFNALTVNDYSTTEYYANGKSYSGIMKNTSVTCGTKWAGMKNMATNNGSWVGNKAVVTPSQSDSSSTLILGGLAAVAVLAAGSYFFVRKKRVD